LALAGALLLPWLWFLSDYNIYVFTLAALYAMPATGLTLFMGYTGQLSIGHAAFYGIGAYVAANLTKAGLPFLAALVVAALASGLVGFALGLVALRLRGFALAMTTLALGLVSFQVFKNFTALTGGVSGLGQIPAPVVVGIQIASNTGYYYLALGILLLVLVISAALVQSPTGRSMRAIAANELASQSLGINTFFIKTAVFALSASFAGLAGGIYAHLIRYISPDDFGLIFSILFLTMAIVGGLRSVVGGLVGSLVITLAAEELRTFPELQPILYGGLLILLVLFMPYGVAGAAARLRDRLARWRESRREDHEQPIASPEQPQSLEEQDPTRTRAEPS
jgi:branched-chain amino acid transport system permease protein